MKHISHRRFAERRHLSSGAFSEDSPALSICAASGQIPSVSAQTIGSVYTSTAPGRLPRLRRTQRRRQFHDTVLSGQGRPWFAGERRRSARNRLGRPHPRDGGQRARRAGLVRSVQLQQRNGRMACSGRQAVRDHPALAPRRHRRRGQERPADRKTDAGGDAAAAGTGVSRGLCRREGQSRRQRTRPQDRRPIRARLWMREETR